MRITLDIDADVLEQAKALAAARKISLGRAMSELARRGVKTPLVERNGFHVFATDDQPPEFGLDDVEKALRAEDTEYTRFFTDLKN